MKIKRRKEWRINRSIIAGRSDGGQIIWKGRSDIGPGHVFLVRVAKDGARQVVGTVKEAQRALERLRIELEAGVYEPPARRIRFDCFLEDYFLTWKRPSIMPHTYGVYEDTILKEVIPHLGRHRVAALTTEILQAWVDGLWARGLGAKTIKNYTSLVRAALRYAVVRGVIKTSPFDGVITTQRSERWWLWEDDEETPPEEAPAGIDMSRVWTAREMQRFVELAPRDDETTRWVRVGMRSGMRPGEQCGLQWSDIDWQTGVISIRRAVIEVDRGRRAKHGRWVLSKTKTGRRNISMPDDAMLVLRAQRRYVQQLVRAGKLSPSRARYVFPAHAGPRDFNNPDNVKNKLRILIDGRPDRKSQVGIPGIRRIPPYGLRHTHATDLLRHGWSVYDVARRLGTSVAMIERHYGHLLPDVDGPRMADMTPLPRPKPQLEVVRDEPDDPRTASAPGRRRRTG